MPKVSRHKKSGKPANGTAERIGDLVSEGAAHPHAVAEQALPNVDSDLQLATAAGFSADDRTQEIRNTLGIGTFGMTEPVEGPTDSPLRGNIDIATWTNIQGWAWDPRNPAKQIQVEALEGDRLLATSVASQHRPDLIPAGIGDGCHGFSIDIEPGLLRAGQHILHLRCADSGVAIPGSPVMLEPSSGVFQSAFRWNIDQITDKEIAGWIVPRNAAQRHCVVALKESGTVLVRAVASQFRVDLLSAGIGDGCYAFTLPMPHSLLDGETHFLEIVEEDTGFALAEKPIAWRSAVGTAGVALTGVSGLQNGSIESPRRPQVDRPQTPPPEPYEALGPPASLGRRLPDPAKEESIFRDARQRTHVMFDVSDLVYYIGHHANLTGIQRVQSSIVLAMLQSAVVAPSSLVFLSFNARTKQWVAIPTGFLASLLRDLFLPESQRLVNFSADDARYGVLPGAQAFDGIGVLDDGSPSVLCLLGAAWVQQDYIHRVLAWKRRFGTRFVMTVHDLIPIYARDTCDQDTARVFDAFMRRALPHVDHVLAVSENTAKDLRRFLAAIRVPEPAITVTKNGSSFAEFMREELAEATSLDLPERFVLFVATIEGRKNHQLIFDVWRRMVELGDDPPHLICVGRLGWKATHFVSALVETSYLDGRVHLLREISDTDLRVLYQRCLFTVCPTLYEGWGLPVGESLAMGKICVSSDRASIPEVAGECGVYIDIDQPDQTLGVIRDLIHSERSRNALEQKIRRDYVAITWQSVAERVALAFKETVAVKWKEPYPFTSLPYSTEVSFGRLDQDVDGTGELVLSRIIDARLGHFRHEPLDQQSFLLGEAIRSGGYWSEPERWGTWVCHTGGEVAFSLAPDASQFNFVCVRLRVCGALQEQPFRLLANGEQLWEGRIGAHSQDLMLRVRKRTSATSRFLMRIRVELDLSAELRNRIAAMDNRIPTVGFERLIVMPENDLKARLEVLSNLILSRQ